MKRNSLILGILLLGISFSAFSQSAEADVKAVIETLFDGMRTKNSNQIASVFSEHAIMQTVEADGGVGKVKAGSVEDFVNGIKGLPAEVMLDEQITDYHIKVDGPLATAWTPYLFYRNNKFSHCGVNSFQLVHTAAGWKIVYIIDTRRKEGCE